MARLRSAGLCLAVGAAVLIDIEIIGAAPFDFLFGGRPGYAPRVARPHRRPATPAPEALVPLPVPRPHFAGDPPPGRPERGATGEAPAPATPGETPVRPVAPTPTLGEAQAPGATVPLPPSKPAEIETPSRPAVTAPTPPETAKPPEVAKPEPGKTPEPGKLEPRPAQPAAPPVAPSGATTSFTPLSPDDDPECPARLAAHHVGAEKTAIGAQPDARCTVVEPVRLADMALAGGDKVTFPDRPTIACTTADAFSSYVRDLLVPLAKGTFGAPIVAVWTGPGLECRSRDHIFGAKLSAHGQGLAIDIAQLKLADGRLIEVGTPTTDAETGFETAARAGACGYFHTVLGPGSDAYHRTHWHFDLEVRGSHGDSKYCK